MKIVVAPASFKGSYPASAVALLMERAIHDVDATIEVVSLPVSDGGEGFADCFLSRFGGVKIPVLALDSRRQPIQTHYARLPDDTAVVELALAAGLHLAGDHPDPSTATTYGVGTLILHAAEHGAREIIVGLGGSATNDAGCGLASALGVRFLDRDGVAFLPVGATLDKIASIDRSGLSESLSNIPIRIACDVTNPLSGPSGAARVFARQKGANDAMIEMLDSQLKAYSAFLSRQYRFDAEFPGAGAAGGTTVALRLFLNAEIERGIDTVLDMLGFDTAVRTASYVFTGEGRLDRQSLGGKAVHGIARRAHMHGVPCVAFAGRIEDLESSDYPPGLTRAVALFDTSVPLSEAVAATPKRLREAIAGVLAR